jgi:hypothetical protein
MTIWRMHIEYCIPKAKIIRLEYVILLLFHGNKGCKNVTKCYASRT